MSNTKLTPVIEEEIFYYKEAKLVFICKKEYVNQLTKDGIIDKKVIEQNYQNNDVIIMHSVDEVISYIQNTQEECFIIGGGKVYKEFLPFAHTLYLTEIEDSKRADTFFPVFSKDDYQKEILGASSENNINYSFAKYTKKSN